MSRYKQIDYSYQPESYWEDSTCFNLCCEMLKAYNER